MRRIETASPGPYASVMGGDRYRQTLKWTAAKKIAAELQLTGEDQEDLYTKLNLAGYYWNSKQREWEKLEEEADPPSQLLSIRLMGDSKLIAADTAQLKAALSTAGYEVVESSAEYPCRPPKQLDSRIYVKARRVPPQ